MWVLTRSDGGRFVGSWNQIWRRGVARTMRLALVVTVAAAVLAGTVAALATPQPVARIVTGGGPCGAASGFGSVWVAVYGTGRLVRIDPRTNRVVARIRVARGICPIVVAAGSVWVASDVTNMLYRIDPRRRRIVARIAVANWPAHVTAAFGSVWVSAYERGTVARVDPRRNRVSRVYADTQTLPNAAATCAGQLATGIRATMRRRRGSMR